IAGPGTRVRVLEYGTDRFGRTLAVVTTGAGSANEAMVAAGLALSMAGSGSLTERLREAEEGARTAGNGFWDPSTCGSDAPPRVVIADLVADPPGPDGEPGSDEVVVVTNREERTVDLTGWVLRDESSTHRFAFPPGTTLAPGAAVEVRSGCEGGPGVLGWCGGAVWNNGGDTAFLLDDRG
ncbi:MAG: endonuclease, partial [Gemmatimonadetes bacterium]|nr:endonuclease [Gemmatimonadota bacterium]NIS33793.1 endonuclease [Actinomycetota bacterium]NIU68626.1 endonuclease [Actinomycetota bacterium]NIV88761.1 endonuclease [Actinomycetota bacterium]NIW30466.1 endonuclease [Actinomycetota bacterium]